MSRDVFIVDAVRTPIGKYFGSLSPIRTDALAAVPLKALIERTDIDPVAVDEVIYGCANQAGEDNRNVARMALLLAGWPHEVPGVTVNRLCGSSLESVNTAARLITCGEADLVVAGGVEHMTRAPWAMAKPVAVKPRGNQTLYDTALGWRFPNPRMEKRFPLEGMGVTAENIVERWGISREDQDAFAYGSHQKALAAQKAGAFDRELVAVEVPAGRRGESKLFAADESPREDSTLEKLSTLRPVFKSDGGSVTAGNSSPLNDGSAAIMLASESALKSHGLTPLARWVGGASAGVDPRVMGIGPVAASKKLLARHELGVDAIDLIELNEAFAAQSLACIRDLELDPSKINVRGGAIALGHPLGASGARILTTLLYAMNDRGARYGLATMCIGVGQGIATLVEHNS
ncbi:MAG TPA: acetyl-CoA C-acyltransferase [Myxococcales bacterium]|nr:acetyl-CoA C-acyltransferase [Myxococcales bacterium]